MRKNGEGDVLENGVELERQEKKTSRQPSSFELEIYDEQEDEAYLWRVSSSETLDFDRTVSRRPSSRRFDSFRVLFLLGFKNEILSDSLDTVEGDLHGRVETNDPEYVLSEGNGVALFREEFKGQMKNREQKKEDETDQGETSYSSVQRRIEEDEDGSEESDESSRYVAVDREPPVSSPEEKERRAGEINEKSAWETRR